LSRIEDADIESLHVDQAVPGDRSEIHPFTRYRDRFLTDDNWAKFINRYFPGVDCKAGSINRAFSTLPEYKDTIDLEENDVGIYRKVKYEHGSKRLTKYYYYAGNTMKPPDVTNGFKWWDSIASI
jgi:hypothetical protein